ncbi:MAG: ABC-2 transporter permease [Xanthomonadales bacterium]|nr:ABC-2 transporter permease [Xanthomonadales bacterium]
MTNNASIIRLLVAKDWQLFQKQLALYVLAGIVALCLLALAKPWAFYLGSLMLIVVVVAAACFSISASLMVERKEHTLAFVMSLPVSPWDFTIAKLLGNLVTFGVPFLVLCLGTLGTVLFTPLPDGLFVYALLIFGYVLFAYSVALSIAMTVESEGWNTFAMIGSMVLINPFIMGLAQIDAISSQIEQDAIVWSTPAVAILLTQVILSVAVLGFTVWHHARKPAFY